MIASTSDALWFLMRWRLFKIMLFGVNFKLLWESLYVLKIYLIVLYFYCKINYPCSDWFVLKCQGGLKERQDLKFDILFVGLRSSFVVNGTFLEWVMDLLPVHRTSIPYVLIGSIYIDTVANLTFED